MKIAVFCPDFFIPNYLASSYIVELKNQLKVFVKSNSKILLLARPYPHFPKNYDKFIFYSLGGKKFIKLKNFLCSIFPGLVFLDEIISGIRILKREKPDVLYGSGTPFSSIFIAIFSMLTKIPSAYYTFEPFINTEWLKVDIIQKKSNCFHYMRNFFIEGIRNILCRQKFIVQWGLDKVDYLIASSEIVRDSLSKIGFKNVSVIYPGVEIPENEKKYFYKSFVTYLGHLRPERGSTELINAFLKISHRFPEVKLVIASSEIHKLTKDYYNRIISVNKLASRIIWKGIVDDVYKEIFSPSAIIVLPHKDGHSLKLIEAMAAGKSVIASDVGWARELISDRISGLLFRAGDVNDLVNKMSFALSNMDLIKEIAKKAKEIAMAKCDVYKNTKRILEILQNICNEKSK